MVSSHVLTRVRWGLHMLGDPLKASLGIWLGVVLGEDLCSLGGPSPLEDIYLPRTLDVPVG